MNKRLQLTLFATVFGCIACSKVQQAPSVELKIKPRKIMRAKRQGGAPDMFSRKEDKALEETFVGVRTSQGIETGLYKVAATGVSTQKIVSSASEFLASLNAEQKSKTAYDVHDVEWRKWLNVDNGIYSRQGVSLKELSAVQKEKAFGLMNASLSTKGLALSRSIMKTDQTLKELNGNAEHFDEELYFFTVMGEPSETQPWGWQIDGHHLALNFFVLGDQVVLSPAFMGAEPVITRSGKHEGNVLFQEEQRLGMALIRSLSGPQRKQAVLGKKERQDMKAAGFSDNLVLDYEGIRASDLSKSQKRKLLELSREYVNNMNDGHAKVKMEEIESHLDNTWFAWKGGISDDSVFYYRVHSPVLLIEFDHQGPVGVKSPNGSHGATRNHIHTMLRTPNGNDYGKDLLRQHLETHHSD